MASDPVEKWTVAELRSRLEDYGDHLPVAIVIERGNRNEVVFDFDVADSSSLDEFDDETHVTLRRYDI